MLWPYLNAILLFIMAICAQADIGTPYSAPGSAFSSFSGIAPYQPPRPGPASNACKVNQEVKVRVRAFIPSQVVYVQIPTIPDGIIPKIPGFPSFTVPKLVAFSADNRSFCESCGTAKADVSTDFTISADGIYTFPSGPGKQNNVKTHRYDLDVVGPVKGKPSWWGQLIKKPNCNDRLPLNKIFRCTGEYEPTKENLFATGSTTLLSEYATTGNVKLHIDAKDPMFKVAYQLVPNVKLDINIEFVTNRTNGVTAWKLGGLHTKFPAFEIYIDGYVAYTYDPVANNASPYGLFSKDYKASSKGIIRC